MLSKPSTRTTNRSAFTLVELLVVIGIIALLISILLPSLNRARESASTLKCLSNMRQLAMGMTQYITDNKGVFPPMEVSACTTYPDGIHWSVLLAQGKYVPTSNMLTDPSSKYSHNRSLRNTWICPSMPSDDYITGTPTTHWNGTANFTNYNFSIHDPYNPTKYFGMTTSYGLLTVGTAYAMYDTFPFVKYYTGGPSVPSTVDGAVADQKWKRRIGQIHRATRTPLIVEGQSMNYWQITTSGMCPYPDLFTARHGRPTNKGWDGLSNVAFFDGHAESIDTKVVSNLVNPTYAQHDFSSIVSTLTLLMRDQSK